MYHYRFLNNFTDVLLCGTRRLTLMWFLTTLVLCSLWSSGIPISSQMSFRWQSALFRQDTASAASTSLHGQRQGSMLNSVSYHYIVSMTPTVTFKPTTEFTYPIELTDVRVSLTCSSVNVSHLLSHLANIY